ncbi:MAG: alpha/beta hydrolase [Bacteroidetes bacterium]|nr:alpha/beta hydrolase [Bacteroidota bacterium]
MLRRIFLLNHFRGTAVLTCLLFLTLTGLQAQPAVIGPVRTEPFVLGITDIIRSTVMNEERTLNIYLPPGYNEQDSVRYPVIYLLDGSVDEDFIHMAGLVYFLGFPWLNLCPPSIVVGIANVDRKRDYTFPTTVEKDKKDFPTTGGSAAFIRYLGEEVIPYIRSRYKTNNTSTLIGQSFGGLLATEVLFTHPDWFSKYLIVSPSLWWDNQSLLNRTVTLTTQPDVRIAVGKEGRVMERGAKALYRKLRPFYADKRRLRFHFFKKENHGSILLHAAYEGLQD